MVSAGPRSGHGRRLRAGTVTARGLAETGIARRGSRRRGPGTRAGRRGWSRLPHVEMTWDFEDGGYWCPRCGKPYENLGGYESEVLDWQSVVRVTVHCRRRYRRACLCPVPATVTAPGPPKAIGKGLLSIAFIAMLITERYVAGRSQNSPVTRAGPAPRGGLARDADQGGGRSRSRSARRPPSCPRNPCSGRGPAGAAVNSACPNLTPGSRRRAAIYSQKVSE